MTNAAARKATVTTPGDREVRIERTFNAPLERVWRTMTEPELIAQWWGRGNRLVVERYEFVCGGHWRFVEHAHGQAYGFEGRFGDITPMQRVVRTFEWDGMPAHTALETATLEDLGNGRTKLVSVSLFMTPQDRDGMVISGMESGVNESYAALERLLATLH